MKKGLYIYFLLAILTLISLNCDSNDKDIYLFSDNTFIAIGEHSGSVLALLGPPDSITGAEGNESWFYATPRGETPSLMLIFENNILIGWQTF